MVQTFFIDYSATSRRLGLGRSELGCFGALELPAELAAPGYGIGARLHDAAGNVSELRTTAFNVKATESAGCGMPTGAAGGNSGEGPSAGTAGARPRSPDDTATPGSRGLRTSQGCGCVVPGGRPASTAAWCFGAFALVNVLRRSRRRLQTR